MRPPGAGTCLTKIGRLGAPKMAKSAKIGRPRAQSGRLRGPKMTEIDPPAAPSLTKIDRFGAPVPPNAGLTTTPDQTFSVRATGGCWSEWQ